MKRLFNLVLLLALATGTLVTTASAQAVNGARVVTSEQSNARLQRTQEVVIVRRHHHHATTVAATMTAADIGTPTTEETRNPD